MSRPLINSLVLFAGCGWRECMARPSGSLDTNVVSFFHQRSNAVLIIVLVLDPKMKEGGSYDEGRKW